jgi:hypothetical protein
MDKVRLRDSSSWWLFVSIVFFEIAGRQARPSYVVGSVVPVVQRRRPSPKAA